MSLLSKLFFDKIETNEVKNSFHSLNSTSLGSVFLQSNMNWWSSVLHMPLQYLMLEEVKLHELQLL